MCLAMCPSKKNKMADLLNHIYGPYCLLLLNESSSGDLWPVLRMLKTNSAIRAVAHHYSKILEALIRGGRESLAHRIILFT